MASSSASPRAIDSGQVQGCISGHKVNRPVMLGSASLMRSLGSTSGTPPTLVLTTCRLSGGRRWGRGRGC